MDKVGIEGDKMWITRTDSEDFFMKYGLMWITYPPPMWIKFSRYPPLSKNVDKFSTENVENSGDRGGLRTFAQFMKSYSQLCSSCPQ